MGGPYLGIKNYFSQTGKMYLAVFYYSARNFFLVFVAKTPFDEKIFDGMEYVEDENWENVLRENIQKNLEEYIAEGHQAHAYFQQALIKSKKLKNKVDQIFISLNFEVGYWNKAVRWIKRMGVK